MNLTHPASSLSSKRHSARRTASGLPRLLRWLDQALLMLVLLTGLGFGAALIPHTAQAAEIDITQATLDASDDGYRLSVAYAFELNRGLEDALTRGVPLYFTTEIQLTRHRWYWFDESAVNATRTVRIAYNVLTRQYHAAISGQLQQSFSSLEDAMALIRRPPRWIVADKNTLRPGDSYTVGLRMRLDVAQLPKPFQINALNNSDWRLSSDWKEFTYKAE